MRIPKADYMNIRSKIMTRRDDNAKHKRLRARPANPANVLGSGNLDAMAMWQHATRGLWVSHPQSVQEPKRGLL